MGINGRLVLVFCLGVAFLTLPGCSGGGASSTPAIAEPVAKAVPKTLEKHGHERVDPYYWLNEREDPEVIAYLEAENEYADKVMAHTDEFKAALFEEIKDRIKKDDSSVPYLDEGFYYYARFEKDGEYAIYCRKKGSLEADEQIMLDSNQLAEGHEYFSARGLAVSSGNDILAFATDTVGRRIYTLHFLNLDTGEYLDDVIPEVTGNVAWANDNKTVFYSKQDLQTLRSYQVYRHELGTDPAQDELVFQEDDDTFRSFVFKTKSKKYLMIGSFHTLSSEIRFLDAGKPGGEFQIFLPRERDHEYSVDHYGDEFFIRTNWKAKNFRLMKTAVDKTKKKHWEDVIAHRASSTPSPTYEAAKSWAGSGTRTENCSTRRTPSPTSSTAPST